MDSFDESDHRAESAVKVDGRAGDVRPSGGTEECDQVRVLFCLTDSSQWDFVSEFGVEFFQGAFFAAALPLCALINPIQTALTRILSLANSLARDFVRLLPAARETLVGSVNEPGAFLAPVVALTIEPSPFFLM